MNHELAKELKYAGFSQKQKQHRYANNGVGGMVCQDCAHFMTIPDFAPCIYFPTLSELIEECGTKFGNLILRKDGKFEVCDCRLNHNAHVVEGRTPTEAVARLWLALQTKPINQ